MPDTPTTDRDQNTELSVASLLAHDGDEALAVGEGFTDPRHATWELDKGDPHTLERGKKLRQRLADVNKELWLVLSMLVIAFALDSLVSSKRVVLGFYTLPTLYSAYCLGRRHATLTALASICLVVLLARANPSMLRIGSLSAFSAYELSDLIAWGGMLMVTAYAMGTLYERNAARMEELRETYKGVLMILRQFISKDKYTENHSWRVSVYATRIAAEMGLTEQRVEDVRAAALLHDIGKLDISREILYKAAHLTEKEFEEMKSHVDKGVAMLEPVGGSLRRILPIVLGHHDRFDGTGYHPVSGEQIPLEARIIGAADAYDAMTSDRPYLKGMSFLQAKDVMQEKAGKDFDPDVVAAVVRLFQRGEMEAPSLVV